MRLSVLLAGCLTVALLTGCGRTHPPDPLHDVDIVASDGVVLKGSYYSPGKVGPGIILIHQCNMDRHAWDTLTGDLTGAGFHVLTFDQRGFGSTGGRADQQKAVADADAAFAYLAAKKDVDKTRIAAGGASCGVTFAAALAARRPEVRALLLLSGWADDASRKYMAATPSLPVFGAADDYRSDGDDIRQAVAASRHTASTARIFSGSAHGVGMFDAHPDLKPSIVTWLRAQLSTDARRSVP